MGQMKAVKGHRYLYRRGDTLVFRRGVPAHAVEAFGGRKEVQVSLGTRDVAKARHLLPRENAKFEKVISNFTGARAPAEVALARRPSGRGELAVGVRQFFAERMERVHETDPTDPQSILRAKRLRLDIQRFRSNLRSSLGLDSDGWAQDAIWMAEAVRERFSWELTETLQTSLRRLVTEAQIEACERQLQMIEGEPLRVANDTFGPEQFRLDALERTPASTKSPSSLNAMLDKYVAESDLAPATEKAYRRQFGVFQRFVGHDDARVVTKKDVVSWKDALLAGGGSSGSPLSPKSVGDTYLAVVKAVLEWAVNNDELETNPATGVRVKQAKPTLLREKGLNDREAQIILRATLSAPVAKLTATRALAQRWIPWICAYTGARVNEITQLRAMDIAFRDGVWSIHITPEAGSTKDRKARTVAMHSHLIEQGLPNLSGQSDKPLFFDPSLHRGGSSANPQSKNVGEHLARWVRSIGVDDASVAPNHGWRHRFKTLARNHRLKMDVVDYIQGHAPTSVAQSYGDVSVSATRQEIERLPRYEVEGASS